MAALHSRSGHYCYDSIRLLMEVEQPGFYNLISIKKLYLQPQIHIQRNSKIYSSSRTRPAVTCSSRRTRTRK